MSDDAQKQGNPPLKRFANLALDGETLCALSRGVLPWWREHIGAIAVAQMAVAGLYGIVLGAKSRQPSIVAYAAIVMLWFFVYMPIRHWKQVEEDERALKRNAENRRSGCRF